MEQYPKYESNALFVLCFFLWKYAKYLLTGQRFCIVTTHEGGVNLSITALIMEKNGENG